MAQHVATPAFEIPEHHRTSTGQTHRKIMMWTFLGSECMFFGSLIGTFLVYHNNPLSRDPIGPIRQDVFSSLGLVTVMAFALLLSSFTMVLGLAAARRGDQKWMTIWLLATAFFGLFFIGSQGFEFYSFVNHHYPLYDAQCVKVDPSPFENCVVEHTGLTPRTNLFGAAFMTLTGFHGAHVTGGVIWLISVVLLVRLRPAAPGQPVRASLLPGFMRVLSGVPRRGPEQRVEVLPRHRRYTAFVRTAAAPAAPPPLAAPDAAVAAMQQYEEQRLAEEKILNVELAGLYWHFVDVVWVVIFTVIYLLQGPHPFK